jgi:hypothetical protein
MNEERDLDYTALSERLSAQTQAYVEVANALVKIIENAATTRDIVNEINSTLKEDYRIINEKLQEFNLNFTVFSNENTNQHKSLQKDLDSFTVKIAEVEKKTNKIIFDSENNMKLLSNNIIELTNYSKKTIDHVSATNEFNYKKLEAIQEQNTALSEDVKSIIEGIDEAKTSWTKAKYLFWAINAMLVVYGILKQFNLINLVIGPPKK